MSHPTLWYMRDEDDPLADDVAPFGEPRDESDDAYDDERELADEYRRDCVRGIKRG